MTKERFLDSSVRNLNCLRSSVMLFVMFFVLLMVVFCSSIIVFAKDKAKFEKYSNLFEKKIDAEERLFRFAQIIAQGDFNAADLLLPKLEKTTKGNLSKRFQFMEAYLFLQTGQYKKAETVFATLEPEYPILADYIRYFRIKALREEHQYLEALKLLEELQTKALPPHLGQKAQEERQLLTCLLDNKTEGEPPLIQAHCHLLRKEKTLSFEKLRELYFQPPNGFISSTADALMEENFASELTASDYQRKTQLLLASDLEKAYSHAGKNAGGEMLAQLAETNFSARNYLRASSLYEQLTGSEAEKKLAQSYARSDQFDKAIALYEKFNAEEPDEATLHKIGFLYADRGDFAKANQIYADLLVQYPKTSLAKSIAWEMFWNHYQLKNYATALTELANLESNYPNHPRADGFAYWRSRLYEHFGKKSDAKNLWEGIASDRPMSYYGFLARKRLAKAWDIFEPPDKVPGVSKLSSIKPWRPGDSKETSLFEELASVGLWEEMLQELEISLETPPAVSFLKEELSNAGERYPGFNPDGSLPSSFPAAYGPIATHFALRSNIPPALVWAIMREESHFRPQVMSPAKAIGLMQIIPQTALEIKLDLQREYFTKSDLLKPLINIEFGAYYLGKMFHHFEGNLLHTIASYNAGPEAVDRWLKARGDYDWDEFVESIPYQETRNYVKRVLRSYYLYRLMYE